jgi:hypothetical protein
MSETISKMQPDRTLYVASFSPQSAIGTIHYASATGFELSGRFNALTDNVILEWNRDNDFEHPQVRYLPDGDFTGLTLSYDFTHTGVADIASAIFPYTGFPYLNIYAGTDESLYQVPLKNYAAPVSGDAHQPASATITLGGATTANDAVTVLFFGEAYSYTVVTSGESPSLAVASLVSQINSQSPTMTAAAGTNPGDLVLTTQRLGDDANLIRGYTLTIGHLIQATGAVAIGGTPATGDQASLTITLASGASFTSSYTVQSGDGTGTVAQQLANAINGNSGNNSTNGVAAFWPGSGGAATILLVSWQGGVTGNSIVYQGSSTGGTTISPTVATNMSGGGQATPTETWTPAVFQCAGGHSPAWQVTLPFGSLTDINGRTVPATPIRKMQWLFSPPLPDSQAIAFQEWSAQFSNWTISGTGTTLLKCAAPGVRYEDDSNEVTRSGSWTRTWGQYSAGGYSASGNGGDYLQLTYHSPYTHDLYAGVFQDNFSGIALITLDGVSQPNQDLYGGAYDSYRARVKLASGIAPGIHTVRLTVSGAKNAASSGWNCNVDFFEAVSPGDWSDPVVVNTNVGFATDFDTAALSLSPQRLAWGMYQLGIQGCVDHFIGIGQFCERSRQGGSFPQCVYTFSGSATPNDQIFLNFGDSAAGHYVQIGDTIATIVQALAFEINEQFSAIFATYAGSVLTVTVRDPSFSLTTSQQVIGAGTETISVTGSLTGGTVGVWQVDPTFATAVNRGTRDWHQDYAATLQGLGMAVVFSYSTELINPPAVFGQQYPDGTSVLTSNNSIQTAFRPETESYWQQVYLQTAQLMVTAGVTPALQFGEIQWWYTPNASGMAYYDSYTTAQFLAINGRALHVFLTNNDDPTLWPTDAAFLRGQLDAHTSAIKSYVEAACPTTLFEVLWPMDVNDPSTRRLNYFVNLPASWTPGQFATFKSEAFGYTIDGDMTDATSAIRFPMDGQGFSPAQSRHIVGIFGYPWPWQRVLTLAGRANLGGISLWAYDEFCLFALPLPLPAEVRKAQFVQ